jgi:predicted O-methyltransferase YrrM
MNYIENLTAKAPPLVSVQWDLPGGHVQPTIGWAVAALLDVIVRSHRPRRILEIGTSFGYSACALGQAAASYGGQVVTLEIDGWLAKAAKKNIAALGLEQTVTVETADAREYVREPTEPFGLILQDGGKEDYLPMLEQLVDMLEPGGLLVSDDVLFPVMDLPPQVKHWSEAIAAYNRALMNHVRLRTAWLPIGDGVAISVKTE